MECPNCKTINPANSKFCHKCGNQLNPEEKKKNPKDTSEDSTSKNNLWSYFADMHDSEGDEREKILATTSDDIWELLTRLATNTFENFIADNKKDLNKQPYKAIEGLKNTFSWSSTGGYWLWLAEAAYNSTKLTPPQNADIEGIRKHWEKLTGDNYDKTYEKIPDEVKNAMGTLLEFRVDNFIKNYPDVKEVPNEVIEKLRTSIALNIIWGYMAGIAESNFRK